MLNRVDYMEHCPTARPRKEQVYRTFRRECHIR
jgi:hypothetical protein